MAIRRAKRRTNFTMISNVGLRDKNLSFKAKGLLAYMLSLPDDWVFYETELVKHSTDGLASIKTGLKELQDNGYLIRKRERNEKGQLKSTDWVVNDEPIFENQTLDKPTLEKPTLEKPTLENQPLLNTNLTKDLPIQNTDITKDNVGQPDLVPVVEIIDYLNQKTGKEYKDTTKKTISLIKARWNEGFTLEDFKRVIDNKVADWKNDQKWSAYLRPATLFNGDKFEGYLNEVHYQKKEENNGWPEF